jgi:polyisoprenoid-binding protein YceI
MHSLLSRIAIAGALGLAALTSVQAQTAAPPESKISITFRQMGVPVDANFTKFSANLQFDPAQPAAASAQFSIDMASFDLGSPDYNKEVLKPVWFDVARHPTATFASSGMKVISPTQLEATGKLTIKGKTQEVRVPVNVKTTGDTQTFDGTLKIQRTAFEIGTGEWKDTSLVADEVVIQVHAVTRPKKK